jgi:hypothetical protein
VSSGDENKKRPRSADTVFFERLAELDRGLPVTDDAETAYVSRPAAGPAERRRSSAMAPRDPRPLIDLFPPVDEPEPAPLEGPDTFEAGYAPAPADVPDEPVSEPVRSPRRVVGLAAALLVLVAAGATAAAYLFRSDLAAILTAWRPP